MPDRPMVHPDRTATLACWRRGPKGCPGGGIGRRTRFRSGRRKAWEFDSPSGHHHPVLAQW